MFRKTDLDDIISKIQTKELDTHRPFTIQYSNDEAWEAELYFFRGAKKYYSNGAHFWFCCMNWLTNKAQGFQLLMAYRYPQHVHANVNIRSSLEIQNIYKDLSPEQFHTSIEEYSLSLKNADIPHAYIWEGQVQNAMHMSDEWNDQSFFAETESEYLVFHWETGA